ncbi:MAG: DinB family protein [Chitinophagales bacterium]
MKKSRLNFQFEKLEATRRQLVQQLSTLDDSVLHYRPANKKWSIVQIIFHLNSSESNSVKYISKKSQGGTSVPKSTVFSSVRSFMLTGALQYFKWKKPAVLPDPPDKLNTKEVMKSWEETRMQLKQLLEKLPDDMLGRNIFRHPATGRMNMSHALTFMQEHFDHHLKQIEERIKFSKTL